MNPLHDSILALRDEAQAHQLARFFKTGPGTYLVRIGNHPARKVVVIR